jgi:hypothetical protein
MAITFIGSRWKAVVAAALLSALGAAEVQAASCKQADLQGEWLVELSTDAVCELKIDKSGSFKKAPCGPQGTVQGTLSGKMTVDKKCAVDGKMEFVQKSGPLLKITVKAKMNKSKDMLSGSAKSQFGSATFKAFQQ